MEFIRSLFKLLEDVHPSLDEILAALFQHREDAAANFYRDSSINIPDMHSDPEVQKMIKDKIGETASLRAETTIHTDGMEDDLTVFLDLRMKDAKLTITIEGTAYASIPVGDGQGIVEHKDSFTIDTSGKSAEDVYNAICLRVESFASEVESALEAEGEGWDTDEEDDGDDNET